jgi:hypothetical protein
MPTAMGGGGAALRGAVITVVSSEESSDGLPGSMAIESSRAK